MADTNNGGHVAHTNKIKEAELAGKYFHEWSTKLVEAGLSEEAVSTALLHTAINMVILGSTQAEAATWLRVTANAVESTSNGEQND